MPGRTGRTTYVPGVGATTRGKGGKAKTFTGKGPAPAGTKKVAEKSYDEVPTTTVTDSGVSTSGYGSQRAAKRAVKTQKRRAKRVAMIVKETRPEPQKRSPAPKAYKAPDVAKAVASVISAVADAPKAVNAIEVAPPRKPAVKKAKPAPAPKPVKSLDAATATMSSTPGRGKKITARKRGAAKAEVRKAKKAVRRSRVAAPLPLDSPEKRKNARIVLRTGKEEGATRKELLAAAETGIVESGGFKNYTDQGETDADSLGWRQERTSIYGNGPTGPTNVKASAQRFYEESKGDTGGSRGKGQTAGELAQTIQGSAFPERYDEVKPQAVEILRAFEKGRPDPKALKRLSKAKKTAVKVGALPPSAVKGGKQARHEKAMWGGKQRGKVTFASWMTDEQKKGVTNPAMRIGRAISGQIGKPIEVISGYRPGSTTTSGNVSDHDSGNALDIHALDQAEGGGVKGEREGDAIARAAAKVAGLDTKSSEFKSFLEGGGVFEGVSPSGYRVQILWKTDVGGNHHNHVHVGLRAEPGAQPGTGTASSVGSGGGSVSFITGGQVSEYAQATGQSVKQVGKKVVNGKLGAMEIYEKLESLGVGGGKPLGVGVSTTSTSQPSTSTLDALEKKYGLAA